MYLHAQGRASHVVEPIIGILTSVPVNQANKRRDHIIHARGQNLDSFAATFGEYAGLFSVDPLEAETDHLLRSVPLICGCRNLAYLNDGDVIILLPSGTVDVLYRRSSRHNTILATERCNSLCLMCTQPPKKIDDSHRVGEILRLAELIDSECAELGISGGEPTLLGDDFLVIIRKFKESLPRTGIHVLTNGRLFVNRDFAARLGAINHPDLMLGIPVYSDIDEEHDYVVQARGAFDETIEGLYNLAQFGVRVEIRVVIHALTYRRLPQLAEFIYRNLPFASHVALMGMEMFGLVHLNLDTLWIDPFDYHSQLEEATIKLASSGMNVSIYNHQLCILPRSLWPFARRSISDWKNVYVEACSECAVRELCGGFFQSATKRHSSHIHPLPPLHTESYEQLRRFVGA